jgi:RNA 2',3'-cyclic 3'-phosphodiesterase
LPSHIRAFIAVPLSTGTKDALQRLLGRLSANPATRAARWVRPASMHLTLKFLGDVPADEIDDLAEGVGLACQGKAPFAIEIAGLGAFPNAHRPRVIWAGIQGDKDQLLALQTAVEEAMEMLGHRPEGRPFSPHLTLARIKRGARGEEVARLGAHVRSAQIGSLAQQLVDEVHLIRSDLRPSGPIYTTLATAKLEPVG